MRFTNFVRGYEASDWYGMCVPNGYCRCDYRQAQYRDYHRRRRTQFEGVLFARSAEPTPMTFWARNYFVSEWFNELTAFSDGEKFIVSGDFSCRNKKT